MKLYFQIQNYNWQPERYKYSVEQMMLMLFPGERPEYPEGYAPSDNEAVFALDRGPDRTVVTARVTRPEGTAQGETQVESFLLDEAPERVYHTLQHALKMAFYRAGTAVLGQEPPWGALTGVRPVKLPTRCMLAGGTPEQAQAELREQFARIDAIAQENTQRVLEAFRAQGPAVEALGENDFSLYVSIPFCPTRCAYCSFVSADVGRTLKLVEPYLAAVLEEVEYTGRVLKESGLSIHSLYVGGGTPTTLSAGQLERLFSAARAHLPLEPCVEYTVEAGRPDTITREKLEVLRDQGVERISINPQTLEDGVLAAIGRKHSARDILDAYALAREVGFDSINMDLIAGLPRDSFEGFRRSLEGVLSLEPENVTVHTLALKKGSRLMEEGGALPSGEETARMLDFSRETLRGAGYLPYYLYRQKYMSGSLENVGWCLSGQESIYNIIMMEELQTVVSIGGGGVTKLVDRKNGRIVRLPNPKYPHDYLTSRDKILAQKDEIAAFYREGT